MKLRNLVVTGIRGVKNRKRKERDTDLGQIVCRMFQTIGEVIQRNEEDEGRQMNQKLLMTINLRSGKTKKERKGGMVR